MADSPSREARAGRRPIVAGVLLGVGLGGFVDGIVLHQILQWHHLLSATDDFPLTTVAGLTGNTRADGIFHAATWVAVVAGITMLCTAWARGGVPYRPRALVGLLLAGWGGFNLIEGLVDHQILGLHHVRDDVPDPLPWDLGFLGLGVLLLAGGVAMYRSALAGRDPAPSGVPGQLDPGGRRHGGSQQR